MEGKVVKDERFDLESDDGRPCAMSFSGGL